MGVSKVIYGDTTVMDISGDTVTPSDLRSGVTAHDGDGESIVGELNLVDVEITSPTDGQGIIYNGETEKWENKDIPSGGGTVDTTKIYTIEDTAETDIDDADYVPFYDTSATAKKKSLWSNIKSVLKTYFDTLYAPKPTILSATLAAGSTSVTFTNIPTSGVYYIDFFASNGAKPASVNNSTQGQITVTYASSSSAVTVYCKIEKIGD